jgi:hypothetical protein
MTRSAIRALPDRDTRRCAQPHINAADGAGKNRFKQLSGFFCTNRVQAKCAVTTILVAQSDRD